MMDHSQGNGFWGVTRSIIEKRPTINPDRAITSGFQGTRLQYDSCKVFDAWGTATFDNLSPCIGPVAPMLTGC